MNTQSKSLATWMQRLMFMAALLTSVTACGQPADSATGDMPMHHPAGVAPLKPDSRILLHFPPAFQRQTLANMRSHLKAIHQITRALAEGDFQHASAIAQNRLTRGGMSPHDRHQAARFMPKTMLKMGAAMHRAAGELARVAQDAAVSGDLRAPLHALARVEARCVACHSTYRMH